MLYIVFVAFITAITIWLHRARAAPHLLFGGVLALSFIGLWMLSILTTLAPDAAWGFGMNMSSTQTVYSVETSVWTVIAPILFLIALPVLLWLQARYDALYYPRLTRWLIWPPIVAGFQMTALVLFLVQLPGCTPERISQLSALHSNVFLIAPLTLVGVYGLGLWSFFLRYLNRDR